jgi:hypothetical protein
VFGQQCATTFERFLSSTLHNGLAPTRPQADRDAIVKQLFVDFAQAVAENADNYSLAWRNHCLVIQQGA